MASENSHKKPDSIEPVPPSGAAKRVSARAPSVWGAFRDALASVFNLEVLLGRPDVPHTTLLDILPELRSSAARLREAFEVPPDEDAAAMDACRFGSTLVTGLEALLDLLKAGGFDRAQATARAGRLADELEASVDLLALHARADKSTSSTDVSLALIARGGGRAASAYRGGDVVVRFDQNPQPGPTILADPIVVGSLVSLVVAWVRQSGLDSIVVRARSVPEPQLVVEEQTPGDAALPSIAVRVMAYVPPAESVLRYLAERIGADVQLEPRRATLTLRPAR